ncbi:MAG: hypothetical protein KDA20_13455, partial [Phycisphaerales bacterium]|nr:hypothetical protein [Phycisphaerales bacterium]
LAIDQPPAIGGIIVNDTLVARIDPARPAHVRLTSDILKQGANTIEIALMAAPQEIEALLANVRAQATFHEVAANLTESAAWASAAWTRPAARDWSELAKTATAGHAPAWYRLTFDRFTDDVRTLWFEPVGLTKGQLFLNGRNLCRYFVATADGKPVAGQDRYWLPTPWLNDDEPNELVIFDEHGAAPTNAKLRLS